jgi:AcrR family transcriptional regulator
MARPLVHDRDRILDAARELALDQGGRAATIEAIAAASGASSGSLYHRFGSRDGVLLAVLERAVARFADPFVRALAEPDPRAAALAGARRVVRFARQHRADATLLVSVRPTDLLVADPVRSPAYDAVDEAVRGLARRLIGSADGAAAQRVRLAVVDLPYGALRRTLVFGLPLPRTLEQDVAVACAAVLDGLRNGGA